MPTDTSPTAVVQRQLDAYNARDVDALVAIYADDARLYEHPDKLVAQGTAALRSRFSQRFTEPNLHAALLNRIVSGNRVIDHERVTRTFPEGPGEIELVMIYEVVDGRIAQAWSIIGPRKIRRESDQPVAGVADPGVCGPGSATPATAGTTLQPDPARPYF